MMTAIDNTNSYSIFKCRKTTAKVIWGTIGSSFLCAALLGVIPLWLKQNTPGWTAQDSVGLFLIYFFALGSLFSVCSVPVVLRESANGFVSINMYHIETWGFFRKRQIPMDRILGAMEYCASVGGNSVRLFIFSDKPPYFSIVSLKDFRRYYPAHGPVCSAGVTGNQAVLVAIRYHFIERIENGLQIARIPMFSFRREKRSVLGRVERVFNFDGREVHYEDENRSYRVRVEDLVSCSEHKEEYGVATPTIHTITLNTQSSAPVCINLRGFADADMIAELCRALVSLFIKGG